MYFCWQPQHPVVTSRAITANCIFELLHEIGLLIQEWLWIIIIVSGVELLINMRHEVVTFVRNHSNTYAVHVIYNTVLRD